MIFLRLVSMIFLRLVLPRDTELRSSAHLNLELTLFQVMYGYFLRFFTCM